jgi:hypothetical protein
LPAGVGFEVADIGASLARILAANHKLLSIVGGLRPETVYVDADGTGT